MDSAVAATRLREMGFDVYGLFLELGLGGEQEAQDTADELGIPLYIAHRRQSFEQQVCRYFVDEYKNARTPNPCIVCNPLIKFRALTDYADEIGAPYIATGHYARTDTDALGRALLKRACAKKDQTYMLYRLSRNVVARCVFPLGEETDKDAVRESARIHNLHVQDKPDSMDICFIPDGDVQGWLSQNGGEMPAGNFVDLDGNVLGRHKGLHCYTVGQRKGLGVAAQGRLFVHRLDPVRNEVVLSLTDMHRKEIWVQDVNYIAPEYQETGTFSCDVRVRYSLRSDRATVYPEAGGMAHVVFEGEVRAPAVGQSAVFYDEDIVIGGGFIACE